MSRERAASPRHSPLDTFPLNVGLPMSRGQQTERPGSSPGLADTSTYENFKSSPNAAPQICAYQPHTAWLLRFCIVNNSTIRETLSPASHQFWGQAWPEPVSKAGRAEDFVATFVATFVELAGFRQRRRQRSGIRPLGTGSSQAPSPSPRAPHGRPAIAAHSEFAGPVCNARRTLPPVPVWRRSLGRPVRRSARPAPPNRTHHKTCPRRPASRRTAGRPLRQQR